MPGRWKGLGVAGFLGVVVSVGASSGCTVLFDNPAGCSAPAWAVSGGGSGGDRLVGAALLPDCSVVACGHIGAAFRTPDGELLPYAGQLDALIVKYSATGEFERAVAFGTATADDICLRVSTDAEGVIYAAGRVGTGADLLGQQIDTIGDTGFVAALTPNLERTWVETIDSAGSDLAVDVAIGSSDMLFVTGGTGGTSVIEGAELPGAFVTGHTRSTGARQWAYSNEVADSFGAAIDQSGGNLHIAVTEKTASGDCGSGVSGFDAVSVQLRADGSEEMAGLLLNGNSPSSCDNATDILVAGDRLYMSAALDGLPVAPEPLGTPDTTGRLAVVGSSGADTWAHAFGAGDDDQAWELAEGADETILVAGYLGDSAEHDPFIAILDPAGSRQAFIRAADAGDQRLFGLQHRDGRVLLSGTHLDPWGAFGIDQLPVIPTEPPDPTAGDYFLISAPLEALSP